MLLNVQGYNKSLIRLYLFFSIFFSAVRSSAQDSTIVQVDKKIEVRDYWKRDAFDDVLKDDSVSGDTLAEAGYLKIAKKYNSVEFNYKEENVDRLSFWGKLKRRIDQFLDSLFPKREHQSNKFVVNLFIFLGIAALVFIIYKLVFSGNGVMRIDKKEVSINEPQFIEKNLERIDLDSYIQQAVDSEKFELAVRYLYLANLQALASEGYIEWDYRKTNIDFFNEIQDSNLKKGFQETTSIYNYVWFGEFEVNSLRFEQYKSDFSDFKNQIKR